MRLLHFGVPWRDFKRVTGRLAPACWMDVWVIWVYPLIIDVTPAIIMDLNKKRVGCNRYKYCTCTRAQNAQKSTVNCTDVWYSIGTWKVLFLQTYSNWQAHIKQTLLFLLFTSLSCCVPISDDWSDHPHTHNPLYWSSLLSLFVFFTSAKFFFKQFLTRQDGLTHETGIFCLFSRFDSLHQLECRQVVRAPWFIWMLMVRLKGSYAWLSGWSVFESGAQRGWKVVHRDDIWSPDLFIVLFTEAWLLSIRKKYWSRNVYLIYSDDWWNLISFIVIKPVLTPCFSWYWDYV